MNILLILLALILLVIASLTVIALGGHRAVPGAAFFNAVGRDGLGVFDTVDDLGVIAKPFMAPAPQAVPAEGPRPVQEEQEPLPLAVPHTGNVERTLSAHDFVEHHVEKPTGASVVSSAEKLQSGEAR
ncbi:taurine ABC transporter substrate-binding protein [Rothia mucilaginosa]|uniref:Taurine ABC transporter substrate-binding protein n=1 Tax=Rothia mucilaginosa TaxID=43675 RepID=A0A943TB13_9MICC|nr:taurine ABC transporter substrate-binding protein [Rothia mucilaginosa]MBS6634637.1 taurine ABC transporter substrate-binding protein [Rothia mucilaginosa]